jgi:hypothetical protein
VPRTDAGSATHNLEGILGPSSIGSVAVFSRPYTAVWKELWLPSAVRAPHGQNCGCLLFVALSTATPGVVVVKALVALDLHPSV